MSWVAAIRGFIQTDVKSVESKRSIFDKVAKELIFGPPGFQVDASAFTVLRKLRWNVLRDGTQKNKVELLEHILRVLSLASERYHYNDRAKQTPQLLSGTGGTDFSFVAEQLQCVAEAKVCGIPLGPAHYRHLLSSPFLAALNPAAPSLILRDISRHSPKGTPQGLDPELREACTDCCVGLATGGFVKEASDLIQSSGCSLGNTVDRIVHLRRDGWESAVRLVQQQKENIKSSDWLDGACKSSLAHYNATKDSAVHAYLVCLSEKFHTDVPLPLIDACIKTADPSQWERVLQLLNQRGASPGMSSPIVGRLMKMLLSCGKPDLALELFYGKEQFGALLASVDKADLSPIKASLTTASGCDSSSSEVHHPAIYNYAMEGWAQIGKWPVVRLVYDEMCSQRPNLVNRHTHKQMTRIILQNNEPLHINLNDSELYWLCASSLERLSQQHDTNNWETAHLTESFLLWTALLSRRSANVVPLSKALSLAADLPHHCRYASCITIGLVLHSAESLPGGKTNADAAIEVFDTMASHPYCSLKQICLASVLLATKADPTLVSGDRFDEKVEKTITSKIRFFVKTQDAMNAFIDLLVEYACAVERRQSADPPEIPEGVLRQRHLLASTLDTMYGRPTAEHFWLTVTGVIQSAAEATGFSPAYAAPALVSAGVSPQIAMSILQHSL